jgi:hypothetical protein
MVFAILLVKAPKRYKIRICKKELKETAMVSFFPWNSAFFCIFIDYRGHHRKGAAIKAALKSIYSQNLGFMEQKMYLEQERQVQTIKNL